MLYGRYTLNLRAWRLSSSETVACDAGMVAHQVKYKFMHLSGK
jgi:hypothetical protein